MIHKHINQFMQKEVTDFNSNGTNIRVFIEPGKAPNFIMRRFDIQPGGNIGVHSHNWEHEIYILNGEINLIDKKGNKTKVTKDEFVYIEPNEPHGYINESNKPVSFICVIPKSNKP
ncbi:MAG: cupin domain-containing protein [Promethearchaeota archaeon]